MEYGTRDLIGQEYEVIEVLGSGGFGIVYLVRSRQWGEMFALKTFKDEFLTDAATRDLFRKEATLWIEIGSHPCIVQALFIEEIHGRLYLALEYVTGDVEGGQPLTLDDLLRKDRPELLTTLLWSISVCDGMEYAYTRGIRCHRDLKPSNIFIHRNFLAKVSDFGLAGCLAAQPVPHQAKVGLHERRVGLSFQSIHGVGAGTPTHMPPEQFIDMASCDQRSDIYSFGIVLFQMATGALPFLAQPPSSDSEEEARRFMEEMFRLHCDAAVPPIQSPLHPVIQRCLQKMPGRRYQSFSELRRELEALLQQQDAVLASAVAEFERDLRESVPDTPVAQAAKWSYRGGSLRALGRIEEALQCYTRALELNPGAADWANKALALEDLHRIDEALECYEKSILIDPNNAHTWSSKAFSLLFSGRPKEALEAADRAVQLAPNDARFLLNKAGVLTLLKRFAEATECLRQCLALDPEEPKAWLQMGDALSGQGKFEEALGYFERALRLDPESWRACEAKGDALASLDRFGEALFCFRRAAELKPENPSILLKLAISEDTVGEAGAAAESFRNFLRAAGEGFWSERKYARLRLSELAAGQRAGVEARRIAEGMVRWLFRYRSPWEVPAGMPVSVENYIANPALGKPIERAVLKAIGARGGAGSWVVKIYEPARGPTPMKWVVSIDGPGGFSLEREFFGPNEQTPEFVHGEVERALTGFFT